MQAATKPIPQLTEKNKRNFWRKVSKSPTEKGCLEWVASKTPDGYGRFGLGGKSHTAHRVSYFLHNGESPGDMCVCHTCDNPLCVNPSHLWIGTHAQNGEDKEGKGRGNHPKGTSHGLSKLTDADIPAIRSDPRQHRLIAKDYGVTFSVIGKVKRHKLWRHVA